jgi:hypothetical protein
MNMPFSRIMYLAVLLVFIGGFAKAGGYLGLFLSGSLGFIFIYIVLSSVWIHYGHIHAVRVIHQPRLQAGDRANVTLTITLPVRYWLCWIIVEERWTPSKPTSQKQDNNDTKKKLESPKIQVEHYACLAYIRGKRDIRCHYTTSSKARGLYRVHSSRVVIGDMFGLMKRVLIEEEQESEIVQVNAAPLAGNWFNRIQQEGSNSCDYGTLRDYMSGDPISSIDWKSMARYQTLKTKQHEAEERKSLLIVMDARESYFECMVSAVTRILLEMSEASEQIMLVCGESYFLLNNGIDASVFNWLASIEATNLHNFDEQLHRAITHGRQSISLHTAHSGVGSSCSIIGLTYASNEQIDMDNNGFAHEYAIQIVYVPSGIEAASARDSDRGGELSYA